MGLLLCVVALAVVITGWALTRSFGQASTDNAYVRGDVTSLAPKVSGYVRAIEVLDNQEVDAGDILVRIDDRDHRVRVAQALANADAARARLTTADAEIQLQRSLLRQASAQRMSIVAELDLATRAVARRRDLIRTNAVSQALVDEGEAAFSRANAALSAASANEDAHRQRLVVMAAQRVGAVAAVAQAEAAYELAQIDLENTVVRAPVRGVIANRQVRLGRLVSPGAALLDIVPTHDLWIVANFKETQIEHIRPGQRVVIEVDGFPDEKFAGVVDSFAPGSGSAFALLPADNATGNFVRVVQRVPVKIRFDGLSSPSRLVLGLSARVEIDLGDGS